MAKNARAMRVVGVGDEVEIRKAIEEFADAFRAKDLDRIVACYAPEIVAFDMMPPLQHSGIQDWRQVWAKSLPMMTGEITIDMRNLQIDVEGNLAIAHALSHFAMSGTEGPDLWMRWTGVFRKIDGRWLATHEHTSVPADMESGKAILDLKP